MAMNSSNRRSLRTSSSSAPVPATAKRNGVSSENAVGVVKVTAGGQLGKKRTPLNNVTNQPRRTSVGPTPPIVPCTASKSKKLPKKSSASNINSTNIAGANMPLPLTAKTNIAVPQKASFQRTEVVPLNKVSLPKHETLHISIPQEPCSMDVSPCPTDVCSFSVDESMSSCGSMKSPDVVYLDEDDGVVLGSVERRTFNNLHISDHAKTTESICKREILTEMDIDRIVNVDDKFMDPQFCATMACDIYKHLRASETKKRPATDFMEKVQKDINASMRAILVDWLVEVAEEYRLVPDTLYLTVNYIDRYLSGNAMNRQQLQLLGVACMMIAAKYEEICAPQVEEFCYITDNTYLKDEVLDMESAVLNSLKFEMTVPTTKCFLRRFVRAAQATTEIPSTQLEFLANYIAELSMLEYKMLQYAPSLIAASSVFLAKYILNQSQPPWNLTLRHYTLYEPSDLHKCVKQLHELCLNSHSSSLPAIREKYSQHKYKFVAKKYCPPPSIPEELFHDTSS